ncbi:MAG: hypothetical protein QF918_06920 [Pirellulaceae bacterium]|jgi:hypothetical protein|nr:hypothetical protein [Pirellulaceae bacterium]MDP6553902.1 hypothetical protein [Pirellulaceae bacterium]
MKKLTLLMFVALIASAVSQTASAADSQRRALRYSRVRPWHGEYSNTSRGGPVALVVPPTAHMQTKMGWGVAQSSMSPIYHRYYRNYQGEMEIGGFPFRGTPNWPSHTDQFGIYYIRGPW